MSGQDLASLPKSLKLWAVSAHLWLPLQLHTHFLIEVVELFDTFDQGMGRAFDARQHFLKQFEGWDRVLQLFEIIGKLEEVSKQGSYDLFKLCLYLMVELIFFGISVYVSLII